MARAQAGFAGGRVAGAGGGVQWEHLRYAAFVGFFLMIWFFPNPNAVSFREDPGAGREGTFLVQLLWFGTFGFALLNVQDRWGDVRQQFDLTLILLLGWCAATVPLAILPDVSMRRYIFTLVAMLVAILCIATPRRSASILWLFLGIILAETLTKYVFVFAIPEFGKHGLFGAEPQLNGLWKGQFAHKNIAGPVCVFELFILYAARGRVQSSWLVLLAVPQVLFLVMSGSKTSLALLVAVFILSKVVLQTRSFIVILLTVSSAVFAINALTILSTLSDFFHEVARLVIGDASFTGRTDVWAMLIRYIGDNPFMGAGMLSFWQIGPASPAATDGNTWVSVAAYGHQGYLDTAATIGLPGLTLALLFLILRPALDLGRIDRTDTRLLGMYVSFWLFGLLHNGTESNMLGRADNAWLFLVIGIAGIRRCRVESAALKAAPSPARLPSGRQAGRA
ncbi:O-antigen ligase family protein [Aureimonas sp. AU40]|uniref:O-antigen ligase family protein n=1 Tax=Aureimonas sp. AU40 TaxID=1637747 RepID=UPI00078642C8|nr:O-antigen ligase family protein [Aureimonas sp. AU40]